MTEDTDTPDDTDEGQHDDWADGVPDEDGAAGDGADSQDAGDGADSQDADEPSQEDDGSETAVRAYLLKGSLVLLVVLGVVATLQFYLSTQTAIRRFASDEFRPVFIAAFNLVVLLAVGIGIAQVVRRLG